MQNRGRAGEPVACIDISNHSVGQTPGAKFFSRLYRGRARSDNCPPPVEGTASKSPHGNDIHTPHVADARLDCKRHTRKADGACVVVSNRHEWQLEQRLCFIKPLTASKKSPTLSAKSTPEKPTAHVL